MKKTMLWRLLALMLALVTVLGCLAACNDKTGDEDETKEPESSQQGSQPAPTEPDPTQPEPTDPELELTPTQEQTMEGLHYFLPAGSEKVDALDNEYAEFKCGDVEIIVTRGGLLELDMEASDAQGLAEYFCGLFDDLADEAEVVSNNGVPVIALVDEGKMGAIGIYVGGGFYWMVEVDYEGKDVEMDELVLIASSGWVSSTEIPGYSGPQVDTTKEIRCESLLLVMDKDYEVEGNGTDSVYATCGDDLLLVGRFENDGKTADELLDFSKNAYEQVNSSVDKLEKDGVGYLLFVDELGYTNVIVVYVQDGYYWEVSFSGIVADGGLDGVLDYLLGATFE